MRIALAQINPTVGDLSHNVRCHQAFIDRARRAGAELVVFPELSITGYPPRDLLLKPQFVQDNLDAVRQVASGVQGIDVVVGYADRNADPAGRPLHNAVAVLRDGAVVSRHFKSLLPTYDVFDESRYFEPGPSNATENLFPVAGVTVGLSVCEDLWNDENLIARRLYHRNPIADLNAAGAELLVNASASPFVLDKQQFRVELFGEQVRRFGKPLVYVNQVGGNDELIFDGNSMVFDRHGAVVARAKAFEEDLLVIDLDRPGPPPTPASRRRRVHLPSPAVGPARLHAQVRVRARSCSASAAGSTRPSPPPWPLTRSASREGGRRRAAQPVQLRPQRRRRAASWPTTSASPST